MQPMKRKPDVDLAQEIADIANEERRAQWFWIIMMIVFFGIFSLAVVVMVSRWMEQWRAL